MKPKKFAIHEGFINSKNDGDRHFIPFQELCRLYGLKQSDCVDWVKRGRGLSHDKYVHLYPRYDGDYQDYLDLVK